MAEDYIGRSQLDGMPVGGQYALSGYIGGFTSHAMGGDFLKGAISAVTVRAFNDLLHQKPRQHIRELREGDEWDGNDPTVIQTSKGPLVVLSETEEYIYLSSKELNERWNKWVTETYDDPFQRKSRYGKPEGIHLPAWLEAYMGFAVFPSPVPFVPIPGYGPSVNETIQNNLSRRAEMRIRNLGKAGIIK